MKAASVFSVAEFIPVELSPVPPSVITGAPVGAATLIKTFAGDVQGRSITWFVGAFDHSTSTGSYVALESFEGSLNDASGTFNFTHAASTTGSARTDTHFAIVPGSGTGGLAGICGTGSLDIDADGTHRMTFDYELVS